MIGNNWVKVVVEDDVHRFDLQRMAISFEDVVDTLRWAVFPAMYLAVVTRLVKAVRMHLAKLVYIFTIADNMIVSMLTRRRIEVTYD